MIFSKKGLTLLEILVAITLFSVMMVFIVQIVKMSLRHERKISRDVQSQREISNILEILSQDFTGVTTFFDFNKNLYWLYPLKTREDLINPETPAGNTTKSPFSVDLGFEFVGEKQEIKFVTFSFVESLNEDNPYQLIKVHYFLQECKNLKTDEKTQCLLRSLISFRDDKEIISKYVLLRGVQSFQFSYYSKEKKEWLKVWEDDPQKWLPEFVKMDIEWEGEKSYKKSHIFPVSYPLLRNQKYQLEEILIAVNKEMDSKKRSKDKSHFEKAVSDEDERLKRIKESSGTNPYMESFRKAIELNQESQRLSPHPPLSSTKPKSKE